MDAERQKFLQSRIHQGFERLGRWQRRALAFLAGAAATLGFAPFQAAPVYVAAIVVLVWLLDTRASERRIARGFALGWFFAFGHFLTGLHWVAAAFEVDSTAWGPLWGIPAAAALAAGMALFWGVGAALASAFWTSDVRRIAAFAAAMFAAEWARGHLFGGFPWLLPGYIWTPGEPISQSAAFIGIYGLTLLTLLFAATAATLADSNVSVGARVAPLMIAALAIGLGWGWGAQRLAGAPSEPGGANAVVRVADSGLGQAEKWTARPDQEWRVLQRYLDVSGGEDSRATVLVWPEGAIPVINFFTLENPEFLDALGRGLGDRVLILGLSRREMHDGELMYYNSAAVIDGVGGTPRLSQVYDKHRLVPFGEFIPLWSLVSRFNIAPLQRIGAGFTAGPAPTRLVVPGASEAVVLICYEAIFPGMIPHGAERPGWIISVTNDAWFGGGVGPEQHYAMARYRTIEEGLPMARAASGGVSAIIDSFGREVSSTRRRGGFAEAQIPPALVETAMARYGNILVLALFVLVAGLRFAPPIMGSEGRKP